jgi:inactivated superfamily I helicase
VETWRELLSVLSTLDEVTDRISYAEAFSTLVHMAGERIFQPKTPEVPVQVMGLLEAAGLEFDGLWITGLHDAAWPDKPPRIPFPSSCSGDTTCVLAFAGRLPVV